MKKYLLLPIIAIIGLSSCIKTPSDRTFTCAIVTYSAEYPDYPTTATFQMHGSDADAKRIERHYTGAASDSSKWWTCNCR